MTVSRAQERAERQAARAAVAAYHEAEMAQLVEYVRDGLRRYDAGEIDVFELDELIHHYKRSTIELWKFCVGRRMDPVIAQHTLERWRAEDDLPDWWEAGLRQRRRH